MSTLEHELKSRDRQEKTKPLGVIAASVIVILAIVGAITYFATRDTSDTEQQAGAETTTSASATDEADAPTVLDGTRATALPATVTCEYSEDATGQNPKNPGTPPSENVPTTGDVSVTFATNAGDIDLTLDRAAAPCAVNSMVYLAEKGFYDDTQCHRITSGGIYVLQCGDPTATGAGGPGFRFDDEYPVDEMQGKPVTYPRGSVAMANAGPGTNGSQFFLNYKDSPLQASYTYFGTIGEAGMKTLDAIAEKGAEGGAPDGKPAEDVKILSTSVSQ